MKAYTYLVLHRPSGKVYYGSRKSDNPYSDLFVEYFTSSKAVKRLIAEDGVATFDFEIRRIFDNYSAARQWETKVLIRLRATCNQKFFNKAVSAPSICVAGSNSENERCKKLSVWMKNKWLDPEFRYKQEHPSERIRSIMSANGKKLLGRKFKVSVRKKRASYPTSYYRKIKITKNGIVKMIHQNQTSAYVKCGWCV